GRAVACWMDYEGREYAALIHRPRGRTGLDAELSRESLARLAKDAEIASTSWAQNCSRYGASATSASSCGISARWRLSASSASIFSSKASSSFRIAGWQQRR